MPSSFNVALHVCVRGSRSESRRPAPARRAPRYVVSAPPPLTLNESIIAQRGRQALPGQECGLIRIESGAEAERLNAAPGRRDAPPVPRVVGEVDGARGRAFEFLDIRLAKAVGRGLREGQLAVDAQGRGGALEPQLRRDAADESRRRLESERGPRERALLALENAQQVYLPCRSEVIARRQAVGGGGRDGKRRALFELCPHLYRSSPSLKQRIGILELHLAGRVVDRVVGFAREQGVAHVD